MTILQDYCVKTSENMKLQIIQEGFAYGPISLSADKHCLCVALLILKFPQVLMQSALTCKLLMVKGI